MYKVLEVTMLLLSYNEKWNYGLYIVTRRKKKNKQKYGCLCLLCPFQGRTFSYNSLLLKDISRLHVYVFALSHCVIRNILSCQVYHLSAV